MNLKTNILTALVLALAVPLHAHALISTDARHEAEARLKDAVDRAAQSYRGYRYRSVASPESIEESKEELKNLAREKRKLRLELSEIVQGIREIEEGYDIDIENEEDRKRVLQLEGKNFKTYLRYLHARKSLIGDDTEQDDIDAVLGLVLRSVGEQTDEEMRRRVLRRSRMRLLSLVKDANKNVSYAQSLQEDLEAMQDDYRRAQVAVDTAKSSRAVGGVVSDVVKRQVQSVHANILRMQAELARIDARLRSRAERALIEKGLRAPKSAEESQAIMPYTPQFIWPVYGRLTAGFMEESYRKFYGVNHRGVDIAVSKGTPVASIADGVVFLARDGGRTGYSYVLVGHRGGYASLYGHLFTLNVSAGQEVRAGQIVGISGGRPGDYGTGPMSTGDHLHLEIMKQGVHINPLSMLP